MGLSSNYTSRVFRGPYFGHDENDDDLESGPPLM